MFQKIKSYFRQSAYKRQQTYDSGIGSPYWRPWIQQDYSLNSLANRRLTSLGVVALALRLYSDALSRFPLRVKNKEGRNVDHYILAVLEKPNSWQTRTDFFQQITNNVLLGGNFIAKIDWNKSTGSIEKIIPWLSGAIWAYPNAKFSDYSDYIQIEKRGYYYRDFKARRYLPDQLLHIRDLTHSADIMGVSRISMARQAFESSVSVQDSIAGTAERGFLNPAIITGSLSQSGSQDSKAAAEKAIREFYQSGAAKRGSAIILPGEIKIEKLAMDLRQADLDFIKRSTDLEIAKIFNLQTINNADSAAQSGAKEAYRALTNIALKPWLLHVAESFSQRLLSSFERRRGLRFCFELDSVASQDLRERGTYLSLLTQRGIISPNEARDLIDLPRIADSGMDKPEREKILEKEVAPKGGPEND